VTFEAETASVKDLHYIKRPFRREPDFAATSVNYDWKELMQLEQKDA
jgi:hypothetical protein